MSNLSGHTSISSWISLTSLLFPTLAWLSSPDICIHHVPFLYAQWCVTAIAKELPSVLKLVGKAK